MLSVIVCGGKRSLFETSSPPLSKKLCSLSPSRFSSSLLLDHLTAIFPDMDTHVSFSIPKVSNFVVGYLQDCNFSWFLYEFRFLSEQSTNVGDDFDSAIRSLNQLAASFRIRQSKTWIISSPGRSKSCSTRSRRIIREGGSLELGGMQNWHEPYSSKFLMVVSFVQQCLRNLSECAAQRLCYDRSNWTPQYYSLSVHHERMLDKRLLLITNTEIRIKGHHK